MLPRARTADEPEAGELAAALAERLRKLEMIRAAAQALDQRPRLGRDIMLRGATDPVVLDGGPPVWTANVYDLMVAFARQHRRKAPTMTVYKRAVFSLADARAALQRITGLAHDWSLLDEHLLAFSTSPEERRTVRASALSVTLEMVKEGQLSIRQYGAFAPIWVKAAMPSIECR